MCGKMLEVPIQNDFNSGSVWEGGYVIFFYLLWYLSLASKFSFLKQI